MGWIYILENKINHKLYVGQTTNKRVMRRVLRHFSNSFNKNKKNNVINKAIKKYNFANFKIYNFNVPNFLLDYFEVNMIKNLNTQVPNGYNLESGGHKNKKLSESTKKKLREINLGKKSPILSEEAKKRISIKNKGKNNGMYGKKSPMKGKSHTQKTKDKISFSQKGRKLSEKTKLKMSISRKKINCKNGMQKPVLEVKSNIIYESIKKASEITGESTITIKRHCNGDILIKQRWKFVEVNNV
jgi:group I intron endonuclease